MLCFSITIRFPTLTVTTCEKETVHRLSCEMGVISVQTVLYGRADTVTCTEGYSPGGVQNTQCSLEGAVDVVKGWCDGKRICEINSAAFASDPCTDTFKYLQTTYTCLPKTHRIICEHSLANLQCGEEQVISVFSANYGRHDTTTCSHKRPYSQLQNTGCSLPTSNVAESCNGKNSCTIKAGNLVFGDPCRGTYKYLEVAYDCEYVATSQMEPV